MRDSQKDLEAKILKLNLIQLKNKPEDTAAINKLKEDIAIWLVEEDTK